MVVLRHLWTLTTHRPAFRAIANDKTNFIRFANGLLNETTSLVGKFSFLFLFYFYFYF